MSKKLVFVVVSLVLLGLIYIVIVGYRISNYSPSPKSDLRIYTTFEGEFDLKKDLLIANYDCKTDVDDLHSVAAFATLLRHPDYKNIQHHAVAGAYGIQGGLYVPPNDLFSISFKNENWSDAHTNYNKALEEVSTKVSAILTDGGDVWIAEAGQSDFSADLIRNIKSRFEDMELNERINLVQHSNWNEEVTDSTDLNFVKTDIKYHKIPDGNALGNGTPGFNSPESIPIFSYFNSSELTTIWEKAMGMANKYNGIEGRYLNESIKAGGLDFSDFSEVCYILNLPFNDSKDFFEFMKD